MNFIEIDNKLVKISNILVVELSGISSKNVLYLYLKETPFDRNYIYFKFDNEQIAESEYNRIKSILIGDNNE